MPAAGIFASPANSVEPFPSTRDRHYYAVYNSKNRLPTPGSYLCLHGSNTCRLMSRAAR
jgi:hypothetical protein